MFDLKKPHQGALDSYHTQHPGLMLMTKGVRYKIGPQKFQNGDKSNAVVPLYLQFHFPCFQFPGVNYSPEAYGPSSDVLSEGQL